MTLFLVDPFRMVIRAISVPLESSGFDVNSSGPDFGEEKEKALKTNGFQGFGGDKRDRTADLLNAIQALSQLSYTPICSWVPLWNEIYLSRWR